MDNFGFLKIFEYCGYLIEVFSFWSIFFIELCGNGLFVVVILVKIVKSMGLNLNRCDWLLDVCVDEWCVIEWVWYESYVMYVFWGDVVIILCIIFRCVYVLVYKFYIKWIVNYEFLRIFLFFVY